MDQAPKLLLLAGLSCSGKSVLGRVLQSELPGLWIFWEGDRAQPLFPQTKEHQTMGNDVMMTKANLRALRAYVDSGFNTIAEADLWSEGRLALADMILGDLNPLTVELRCEPEELERRELARGTTLPGTVRSQMEHEWQVPADLVLDSSSVESSDLAKSVVAWLAADPRPRGLKIESRGA